MCTFLSYITLYQQLIHSGCLPLWALWVEYILDSHLVWCFKSKALAVTWFCESQIYSTLWTMSERNLVKAAKMCSKVQSGAVILTGISSDSKSFTLEEIIWNTINIQNVTWWCAKALQRNIPEKRLIWFLLDAAWHLSEFSAVVAIFCAYACVLCINL